MIIKVCGMRLPENIAQVATLGINWMGFIFFQKSPRFMGNYTPDILKQLPHTVQRVGVFVNASYDEIIEIAKSYELQILQLHGEESTELCTQLRTAGYKVMKAISVRGVEDIEKTNCYEPVCDYLLFDTKCDGYGGSGKQFDWSVLNQYKGSTPFLLSGGITPDSVDSLIAFTHPQFIGIDLNSGFESQPGIKQIEQLQQFIIQLKAAQH